MNNKPMCKMFCIILIPLLFAGCYNRKEINQLGIVGALGYDMEGDKIQVTSEVLKTYKPKGGKGESTGASEAMYTSSIGSSFFDARRNTTLSFDRKLFFPHVGVHLFGQDVASKGIGGFLDLVVRNHEDRLTPYMFVVKNSKASDIMGGYTGIEEMMLGFIAGLARSHDATSQSVFVDVNDFLNDYYSQGRMSIMGVIEKVPKSQSSQATSQSSEAGHKYELKAQGLAIFNNDSLQGFLSGEETLGYNFASGEVESTTIVTTSPDNKGTTTCEVTKSETKQDVELNGNTATLKLKINMTCMVDEEWGESNIDEIQMIKKVEEAMSEKIKTLVENTVKKVQVEFGLDIFGFGDTLHKQNPKQWKEVKKYWHSIFAVSPVEVEVKTTVSNSGTVTKPIRNKEG